MGGLSLGRWSVRTPLASEEPEEIPALVALIKRMSTGRKLVVAMESSGTYGDALRQALADAEIEVQRVSSKASHDYAEVFDGVPSQHDGKDAAVVAELAALGKAKPWEYQPAESLGAGTGVLGGVDGGPPADADDLAGTLGGAVGASLAGSDAGAEALLGDVAAGLEALWGPQALAADPEAAKRLARWGRAFLAPEKIEHLLAGAGSSVGVRVGEWQRRQIQDYAQQALAARREAERAERRLRRLAAGHAVLQAQGKVVGVPTACVLWASTGDPRKYHAAAAYRKAMGLNLVERSSGTYQGRLRISKRGSARSRQWLYFAVLRLVQQCGVRPWYEAKKARDEDDARRVLVAVMRKLAVALYHVGVHDEEFQPRRLFGRIDRGCGSPEPPQSRTRSKRRAQEGSAPGSRATVA